MNDDQAYADEMAGALDIARGCAALAAEGRNADLVAILEGLTDEEQRMVLVAQAQLAANYATLRCAQLGIPADRVPEVIRSRIGHRAGDRS